VKKAIMAGFIGTKLQDAYPTCDGYYCKSKLPKLNFKIIATESNFPALKNSKSERIEWCKKNVEPGDVAVMSAEGHEQYGHICMYCGDDTWVSDFNQRSDLYVYTGKDGGKGPKSVIIFRYAGKRIMPKTYHKVSVRFGENLEGLSVKDVVNNITTVVGAGKTEDYSYVCYKDAKVMMDIDISGLKVKRAIGKRDATFNDLGITVFAINDGEEGYSSEIIEGAFTPGSSTLGKINVESLLDGDIEIEIKLKKEK
jgi:hypothetical protein